MILVTGTSGFIGSRLLDALIKEYGKENVLAFSSKDPGKCAFLYHNDYTFKKDYFVESGYGNIDTIIHAGAFTPKTGAQANNWQDCNGNILATHALLSANLPQLKKFIFLSTLDVYADADIITEKTLTIPATLYGQSKLYCEKMVTAWAAKEGKTSQILRIGHVFGPGEEAYRKIIPATISRLINDQAPQLWGTGKEIRCFIYIDDVISAIRQSVHQTADVAPVNIVSSNQITVLALIEKLIALKGDKNSTIDRMDPDSRGKDLIFDNTRMKSLLLSEESDFDAGLKKEWEYMNSLNK